MDNKTPRDANEQLADIAKEFVRQNKSRGRWRKVLLLLFLGYVGVLLYVERDLFEQLTEKKSPFAAEVSLRGSIFAGGDIDADDSLELLQKAFAESNAKAVILRLNSPGGSPVQASQIYHGILQLKAKYNKKVYAVIDDICASGCYYIAASADEIYADESSIIGSIGVAMAGFGAVDLIKKIGLERRLYTAGKFKGLLDPFTNENAEIIEHIQHNILDKSHQNFIQAVQATRGGKLSTNADLFSGLIWLGKQAQTLGLIDGIADANTVAKKMIGVDTRILYEQEKTLLEELTETSAASIAWLFHRQLNTQNGISRLH